ncbi:MAG: hypothetical protein IKP62_05150 [Salinivirgaceae bacterium]|nr:hypothetical protein [Salinivirgaceae bacterium]
MKRITIRLMAAIALLFTTAAATMAQGSFAYQAVIRTADGKVVSNQKVGMRFTLLSDGTSYYSEVHTPTTNEFGNISVMIGSGTKESGDFMNVPWSKMNLMLKIEVDAKGGTNYTELGQTQLLSVPYAMYAQTAGKVEATQKSSSVNEPIFEVKDKDGNLVFAVYPDGVKVYVDDTDVTKAKRSGFVVTGRSATKDGESADYFAVNAEGTQVFIDDTATSKAKRSGFVVTGRSATKGGENADYLAVNGNGTQVYVDDPAEDKAKRSGFVVTGRSATKDANADVLKIDGAGTQVFIDDSVTGKAKRSGFVVTGRSATKDADAADYLAINGNGTQVYVNTDVTDDKAKRSGFVVTGRSATKDEELDVFVVDGLGTQVFIDETDESKAKRSGFVVTGRSATKDSGSDYFKVTSDAVNVSISSFNVSDKTTSESVFAIKQGNVQVNSDLLMTGEVGKVVDAEAISDSIFTINLVGNEQVVATIDTIDPDSALVDGEYGMYALLRITDNSYVPVYEWDSLMFDARGYATTNKKSAVVSVRTTWDGSVVVNPLQKDIKNFTAVFGLTWTRSQDNVQESFVFKKVMIVSENQSQGQGQGGNQSQVQGGFYGVEKGHMIINTFENGETHQIDYYFLDYGNKEYYTYEGEDGEIMIYYTDWESSLDDNTKEYIYVPEQKEWLYYTKQSEGDAPIYCYPSGNEDYAVDGGEINGLRTKLYQVADGQNNGGMYVYEGIRVMIVFNGEVAEKIESFDFNSDVQDFFEWAKGKGYDLPGKPE